MKDIEQLATQFRKAIDAALEAGEFDNDSIYRRFPRACCGDTSDLLAQYLLDKGIKTDYVCGTYWGKTDGNVIIPELSEPPVRTVGATIPENESHIFR